MEGIAACLAADLGLPVSEPLLVEVTPEWISLISNSERRRKIEASSRTAFGSRLMTGQFALWNTGTKLTQAMVPAAAAILAFDGIIQNPDRRVANPNCFVRGDDIRIFDHELAFSHRLVLQWQPPWKPGGLSDLEKPGFHIFRNGLRQRDIDFNAIRDAWSGLSDAQIARYGSSLPAEWEAAQHDVEAALTLIRDARNNIDECIVEIQRVLK